MDATTFLIIALILYVADRRDQRTTALARLALGLAQEKARADEATRRLEDVRADILRARAHMRRGLSPIVQRYGIDDPDLIAMSGILHQLTEGEDHARRN